jgi:hypothetical protein
MARLVFKEVTLEKGEDTSCVLCERALSAKKRCLRVRSDTRFWVDMNQDMAFDIHYCLRCVSRLARARVTVVL